MDIKEYELMKYKEVELERKEKDSDYFRNSLAQKYDEIEKLHDYIIKRNSFYSTITYTTIMCKEDKEELLALGITVDEINEYMVRANCSKGE